jgi:hypothetical protein
MKWQISRCIWKINFQFIRTQLSMDLYTEFKNSEFLSVYKELLI